MLWLLCMIRSIIGEKRKEQDMIKDIVEKSRSVRRFEGDKEITQEQLRQLVDLARLSPSGGNRQTLKYAFVNTPESKEKVFEAIGWAGYLKEWGGPAFEERPSAYIILLEDLSLGKGMEIDIGIAAQSIFLGATEAGLAGCFIGNIKRESLMEALGIEKQFHIALIVALGYGKEQIVIEEMKTDGDVKYWRDAEQVHHVPKRSLEQLIVKEL